MWILVMVEGVEGSPGNNKRDADMATETELSLAKRGGMGRNSFIRHIHCIFRGSVPGEQTNRHDCKHYLPTYILHMRALN